MTEAPRRVAYGTVASADGHDTGNGHPERHARLVAVEEGVARADLGDALVPLAPRPATVEELSAVHDLRYLLQLEAFAEQGGGHLDPDTVVCTASYETAQRAAGLGLAAIDALRRGEAEAAFVAPRPPGHHANADRGSGFCLVNNVAVAARALADAGERVLILDWDVHHGNGTQEIFWNDPRVLYVSTHQSPAYPGTGHPREIGGPSARGTTINAPLPAGATGDVALRAIDDIIVSSVDPFGPTWVLISAGYDAHRDDPLADLAWSAGDYAALTKLVAGCAPATGRTVCFLEGGYDLDALAASTAATLAALAGQPAETERESSGGPGMAEVEWARRVRNDHLQAMA
jgi:acetoin utilization deacetylase AcuC-like enzyme